ncbi:hypothetical protein [uncultured Nonlabens sp.]
MFSLGFLKVDIGDCNVLAFAKAKYIKIAQPFQRFFYFCSYGKQQRRSV